LTKPNLRFTDETGKVHLRTVSDPWEALFRYQAKYCPEVVGRFDPVYERIKRELEKARSAA
jgi:hypothetical protein